MRDTVHQVEKRTECLEKRSHLTLTGSRFDILVESTEPITAAMDGRSFVQIVCVTSAPKNMNTSSRAADAVNARANDTMPLTPPSFALNF